MLNMILFRRFCRRSFSCTPQLLLAQLLLELTQANSKFRGLSTKVIPVGVDFLGLLGGVVFHSQSNVCRAFA